MFLRVTLDSKLTFETRLQEAVSKAVRGLGRRGPSKKVI